MTCLKDRVLSGARMLRWGRFLYTLGTKYANFQEKKSLWRFLGKSSKVFIVVTNQNLELFPRNLSKNFFLKIGIHSAKVYIKNFPNIEVCDFYPAPPRTLSIKKVIVVLYYYLGW